MTDMILLPFNPNAYTALVSSGMEADSFECQVAIMNGELEKLLYRRRIIIEVDSVISEQTIIHPAIKELQSVIVEALTKGRLMKATYSVKSTISNYIFNKKPCQE